jgi:TM2 domain-containing membrane protein YozV
MADNDQFHDNQTVPSMPAPPPPLPQAAYMPAVPVKAARSPVVALILSLFPGLGQMYNGQIIKALVFFFTWAGCIWLATDDWHFGIIIPFVYLTNLVDAWRTASYLANRPNPAFEFEEKLESPAWGIGLIALGAVLLMHNLGWLQLWSLGRYWPLLLIGAGVVFVWNAMKRTQA